MSREPVDRIRDIEEAVAAIRRFERAGRDDPMVFDAVRMRLLEIGEAAGGIPADLRASDPGVAWRVMYAVGGGEEATVAATSAGSPARLTRVESTRT